jgi:endonuclease/exonuclease/phosphatase family metal-dependent hydrolase
MREISLLTFNAGLLSAFGGLLEPAPFVRERLASLPQALADFGADFVLLQEVYDGTTVRSLARGLRSFYPYVATPWKSRRFSLGSGLMVLAREPVTTEFHPFRAGVWEERMLADRGYLVIHTLFDLTILNFHATAGGVLRKPQSPITERTRGRQIDEMLAGMSRIETPIIVAGDLNAGPNASAINYHSLEAGSLVDAYALLNPDANEPTWDPTNSLNAGGPHTSSPPQRCDHIFVRHRDLNQRRLEILRTDVVLTEKIVPTLSGNVTLSDHYGVSATFRIR